MTRTSQKRRRIVKPAEEREREILDAAFRLFHEKGFAETTVQDIAAGAGVATGTVYLYYPSKDHVLLALHEDFERGLSARFAEMIGDFIERRNRGEAVDSHEIIDTIVDGLIAYARERRDTCAVICRYIPQPDLMPKLLEAERAFVEFLTRAIEEGIEAGRMQISDPEMAAYLINAAMTYTVAYSVTYGQPADLRRLAAQAKELLYKALMPADAPARPVRRRRSRR